MIGRSAPGPKPTAMPSNPPVYNNFRIPLSNEAGKIDDILDLMYIPKILKTI